MSDHRDSPVTPLADYPHPSVAVDTAVLTVQANALCVVLVQNELGWRLPGTFVHEGETLADAVLRSLRDKASIEGLRPHQLRVFDAPERDDRGWVMSVAHLVVVPAASVPAGALTPWDAAQGLVYDHEQILRLAVDTVRAEYAAAADPERLLGPEFTLLELLRLHESVAGARLGKDTFRRRVLPDLVATDAVQPGKVGKPAQLFRHR
ncbi:8-oxo-dGTP diphosphatase [Cryobacterium sp. MP_M5]|uniref:NUDIX hydrolase n=1 Tax=unclassified Cryobacterium TaxID=2649013 RepID=UPI0018CB5D16|nr:MULTISPECIES: NUDIX hydrolase [unclassified Cryobacterium]MBG6058966.1 ADP-ribose pyrophosphatase YjhB (NUDIX family) [Cryobacterium sp. MP_M3]MEC5178565.1 8-oxo-dGTP diphosphatase [Cryobacterium sp. MP_M5]